MKLFLYQQHNRDFVKRNSGQPCVYIVLFSWLSSHFDISNKFYKIYEILEATLTWCQIVIMAAIVDYQFLHWFGFNLQALRDSKWQNKDAIPTKESALHLAALNLIP